MSALKQVTLERVQKAMSVAGHVMKSEPFFSDAPDKARATIDLARLLLEEDERQQKRIIVPGIQ